jgi:hypothetical protein
VDRFSNSSDSGSASIKSNVLKNPTPEDITKHMKLGESMMKVTEAIKK